MVMFIRDHTPVITVVFTMGRIVQIRLPDQEVDLIDALVKKKQFTSRSDFIKKAVAFYIPSAQLADEIHSVEAVA